MKRFGLCLMAFLAATIVLAAAADRPRVGITVIQEPFNPIAYDCSGYETNPVGQMDISRYNGEDEISARLNALNVGKRVVDHLLGYDGQRMNLERIMSRIPEERRAQPDNLDYALAVMNNYILVVKLDDTAKGKALRGDTAHSKPTGEWYLYQLDFGTDETEEMKTAVILPGDTPEARGSKRVAYENLTVGIRLIGTGTNVKSNLPQKLRGKLKYIDRKSMGSKKRSRRIGTTSTALKVALSPFIILKK